jgi:hypothetical protein
MSSEQLLIELEIAKQNNDEALVYEIEQILGARS